MSNRTVAGTPAVDFPTADADRDDPRGAEHVGSAAAPNGALSAPTVEQTALPARLEVVRSLRAEVMP